MSVTHALNKLESQNTRKLFADVIKEANKYHRLRNELRVHTEGRVCITTDEIENILIEVNCIA